MNAFLTAATFVVLIAARTYVIHRLNIQPLGPGRSESPTTGERRDHRDGGRGRFPPRRSRTAHLR